MYRLSGNLEAFFKLCKKYGFLVTNCIVHENSIVNTSVTVALRDGPYKYRNRVKVDTALVREGRMDEIESLLIGCAMEGMFE